MVNNEYFLEVRNHGVPKMNPLSLEYHNWWKEEKRRCIEGYWVGDTWMPGVLYYYVNYWHIELSEEGSSTVKSLGKPLLRDLEWEFFPEFEKARCHSGFTEVNGIMVPEYKNQASGIMVMAGRGCGKCFEPGTKILMYDGSILNIEDVRKGDVVMGPDSKPRNVLSTHSGVDDMYEIVQKKGISYTVNSEHILVLHKKVNPVKYITKTGIVHTCNDKPETIKMSVKDYLKLSDNKKKRVYRGFKTKLDFKKTPTLIDPYVFGLWLADGRKNIFSISVNNKDVEIIIFLKKYAATHGYELLQKNIQKNSKDWFLRKKDSEFITYLIKYNVYNNKHIPKHFIINSEKTRLELLAGYLDGDGCLIKNEKGTQMFSVSTSSKRIFNDVVFLGRTLGLGVGTSIRNRTRKEKKLISYEIRIYGGIDKIPTKLKRKQVVKPNKRRNNVLLSKIKVQYKGYDEYYGFTLDDDGLFLLEDMTVVHNSNWAAVIAGHGYTFFKNNEILVSGFESKYTGPLMEKIRLGIDNYPGKIDDFGGKPIPHPFSHRRYKNDWGKKVMSGYRNTGDDTVYGFQSRIIPIVFKETHTAANGKRASVHIFEEIGMHENLMDSYNSSTECWMNGSWQFGTPFLLGTGGDMDKGTVDAEKMFYDPDTYNIRSYVNLFEKSDQKIAYFIPGWKGLNDCKDEQGVTDEVKAKNILMGRRERKKLGNDPSAYYLELQYQPLIPREAFLRKTGNIYPTALLEDQLRFVMSSKSIEHIGQKGKLEWTFDGEVKWVPDENVYPVDFPAKGDLTGCVTIWEHPEEGSPTGLYVGGTDPYRQDQSEYSPSIGATIIYKRFLNPEKTFDWPVAEYAGRPETSKEHDEEVRKLLVYYGAKTLYENEIRGLKQHFEYKNCLHLLAGQPEVIYDIIPGSKVSRGYGIHMVKLIKDAGETMIRDWLLEEYEPGRQNARKIFSIPLLKELIGYDRNDGNFDRHIAFMLCMLHNLEVQKHVFKEVEEFIEDDFLAKGYKKLGNGIVWD